MELNLTVEAFRNTLILGLTVVITVCTKYQIDVPGKSCTVSYIYSPIEPSLLVLTLRNVT